MIFFLNSTDRVYNDKELNAVTDLLLSDGVLNSKTATHADFRDNGDLLVEANGNNLTLTAGTGRASVSIESQQGDDLQGLVIVENTLSATLDDNLTGSTRNDAVILRVDQSIINNDNLNADGSNAISLATIAGSDSEPLTDTEIQTAIGDDGFVRLANVSVPSNASSVSQSNVEDARSLAKMTRDAEMGSDKFQFYALPDDPNVLEKGDVWYNQDQDVLKVYDGEKTQQLQTQTFGRGYYPPNGINEEVEINNPIAENDSRENVDGIIIENLTGNFGDVTQMAAQKFTMPNVQNLFMRVKTRAFNFRTSSVERAPALTFEIWSISSGSPDSKIETVRSMPRTEVPINDYIDLYAFGDYSAGTDYFLIIKTPTESTDPSTGDLYRSRIAISDKATDSFFQNAFLLTASQSTTDPTSLTLYEQNGEQFIMEAQGFGTQEIAETDNSGNYHDVAQPFIAKSEDISTIRLLKAGEKGSPSGDVTGSLYEADSNGNPTGSALTQATISEGDIQSLNAEDNVNIPINYSDLTVGNEYVFVLEGSNNSDTNNYQLAFLNDSEGSGLRRTSNEGWVTAGGDFVFAVITQRQGKIVISNEQGFIPDEMVRRKSPRVDSVENPSNAEINIDGYDAKNITKLTQDISGFAVIGNQQDDFQEISMRIENTDGSNHSINWGNEFAGGAVGLPTTVTSGNTLHVKFQYDADDQKWRAMVSGEVSN